MKTVMKKETVMKEKKENHQKSPSKVNLQVSLLVLEEVVEEWLVAVVCLLVKGVEAEAWPHLAEECLLVKGGAAEVWPHLAEECHLVNVVVVGVWPHQVVVWHQLNEEVVEVCEVWACLAEVCLVNEVAVVSLQVEEVCQVSEVAVVWLQAAEVHLVVVCLQVKEEVAVAWLHLVEACPLDVEVDLNK